MGEIFSGWFWVGVTFFLGGWGHFFLGGWDIFLGGWDIFVGWYGWV